MFLLFLLIYHNLAHFNIAFNPSEYVYVSFLHVYLWHAFLLFLSRGNVQPFNLLFFSSFWLLIVHKDQDPPNRVICPEAAIKYFFMFSYLGESALENSDYAKISSYLRL